MLVEDAPCHTFQREPWSAPPCPSVSETSGTLEQIRAQVRQLEQQGADVIKLFATACIRDGGKTMTKEQIDAACGEAKAGGLRSAVHAHGSDGARLN